MVVELVLREILHVRRVGAPRCIRGASPQDETFDSPKYQRNSIQLGLTTVVALLLEKTFCIEKYELTTVSSSVTAVL